MIATLNKIIREKENLIQTEKDNVGYAQKKLQRFKRNIEEWYPDICANVDFANTCSNAYRISDEIVKQLLNGKIAVCSGKFLPKGEKVPFELNNAVFSSKMTKSRPSYAVD